MKRERLAFFAALMLLVGCQQAPIIAEYEGSFIQVEYTAPIVEATLSPAAAQTTLAPLPPPHTVTLPTEAVLPQVDEPVQAPSPSATMQAAPSATPKRAEASTARSGATMAHVETSMQAPNAAKSAENAAYTPANTSSTTATPPMQSTAAVTPSASASATPTPEPTLDFEYVRQHQSAMQQLNRAIMIKKQSIADRERQLNDYLQMASANGINISIYPNTAVPSNHANAILDTIPNTESALANKTVAEIESYITQANAVSYDDSGFPAIVKYGYVNSFPKHDYSSKIQSHNNELSKLYARGIMGGSQNDFHNKCIAAYDAAEKRGKELYMQAWSAQTKEEVASLLQQSNAISVDEAAIANS